MAASITVQNGTYSETLTTINDTLYTLRYILLKNRSEWHSVLMDEIRRGLEDKITCSEIQHNVRYIAKDLSIRKGNHID